MSDVAYPSAGLDARGGRLRFAPFEMDLRSGEIWKAGTLLKLAPQPFRILALLAQDPGVVVTREEIRQHIWGDGTVVDFDQRLNACINQIRSVLGDDADLPRFVETLPRRGYRWVGPPPETLRDPAEVVPFPQPTPAAPELAQPPRRALGVRGAALVAALVAGSATLAYVAGTRRAAQPTWKRLTFHRGAVAAGRFTPSGEVLYGAEWEGRACSLYSVVAGSPDPHKLRDDGCVVVGVSPAGELAFLTDVPRGTLAQASMAGGPAKERRQGLAAADWARDGTFAIAYFVPGRTQMQVEWPAGNMLASVDSPSHLRVSPDGRHLAMFEHPVVGDDRGHVVVFDRAGKRRVLTQEWQGAEGLAWGPDGNEVWFTASEPGSSAALYAVSLAGGLRRLLPPDRQLVLLDVAPDGRVLLDRGDLRQEVLFGRPGESERNLSWLDMSSVVALSADGSRLLLNETGAGGGPEYGVYLRPSDGALPLRLGKGRGTALSPDGQSVMTIPIRERDRIEIVPTGAGEARTIRDADIVGYEWSFFFPDGRRILFVGKERSGAMRLFVRELAGGRPRAIAPENVRAQKVSPISPDGTLVFARCPDADYCLYPVDAGEPRKVPGMEGLRPIAWDTEGRALLTVDRSLKFPLALYRVDLATGRRTLWRTLAPPDPAGVSRVTGVIVTSDWSAYAYDYMRRLSEIYVVEGLR